MNGEVGRCRRLLCWLVAVAVAVPAVAAGWELELSSEFRSGRFAPQHDSDLGALSLTFATGDKLSFRAEVPYLSVRVPEAAVLTGLGLSRRELRSLSPERLRALVERAREWRSGLGDLRLALAAELAGGGAKLNRLAAELEIKAPTADEAELLGTGEWDVRLGLDAQRRGWSITTFAGLGWNWLGQPADLELNDVVDGYLGLESEPVGGSLRLSGWIEGNSPISDDVDSRLAVGVGMRGGSSTAWQAGVTVGLTDDSEEIGVELNVSVNANWNRRRRP